MAIEFHGLNLFLLVFVRLCGMIFLNPLLSRRNVPNMVRMGLIFFLTILIAPTLETDLYEFVGDFDLALLMFKELAVGALLGYVFQIFYYMLFFVGDYMDTAFGMSMSKIFDPGTNVQMSLSGNFLSIMFILYIFATNSHLALIQLFSHSFKLFPPGGMLFSAELAKYGVALFQDVFLLAIRLALPFAVAEFALEMSMGILMKVIPQIHIFVINFQLKMGLGMLMLYLFAPYVSSFMDNYIVILFDTLQNSLVVSGGIIG